MASGKTSRLNGFFIERYKVFIDLLVAKLCQLNDEIFDKTILSVAFNQFVVLLYHIR